jgi:lysozyme
MITSQKGIDLIKRFEGCSLKAYKCPAGKATIGYGNTYYENGEKVLMGERITQERAEQLLLNLLPRYENAVNIRVTAELTQNQYDALVSFTWNTGGSNDLFKMINLKMDKRVIAEWIRTHYTTAGGVPLKGLIIRRDAEADLYEL